MTGTRNRRGLRDAAWAIALGLFTFVPLPLTAKGERKHSPRRESAREHRLGDFHSRLTGVPRMQGDVRSFEHGISLQNRKRDARGVGVQIGAGADSSNERRLESMYRARTYPAWGAPSSQRFKNEIWGGSFHTGTGDGLRLQGEYAISRKGHPALQRAQTDVTGEAYLLDAQYSTTLASWAGQPLVWQTGMNRRQAEHAFWSPPTGAAVPGKQIDRASSSLSWGNLSAGLQYQQSTELPHGGAATDGIRADELDLDLAYSIDVPPSLSGLQPLLGDAFRLSMTRGRGTSFDPATGARRRSRSIAMQASFTPGRSRWQIRHSRTVTRDRGSHTVIGGSNSTALFMMLPFMDELTLTPRIEWTESTDIHNEYDTVTGTLGGTAGLIPGTLSTRLQLRARQHSSERQDGDCMDVHAKNGYNWIVRRSGRITPRISLSMSGNYHYTESSPKCSRDTERYAAFAGLEMRWSAD